MHVGGAPTPGVGDPSRIIKVDLRKFSLSFEVDVELERDNRIE